MCERRRYVAPLGFWRTLAVLLAVGMASNPTTSSLLVGEPSELIEVHGEDGQRLKVDSDMIESMAASLKRPIVVVNYGLSNNFKDKPRTEPFVRTIRNGNSIIHQQEKH